MNRKRTHTSPDEHTLPGETVGEVIAHAARSAPQALWLVAPDSGRRSSYSTLLERSDDVARRLGALGLRKGDVVSFLLGNGPGTAELILGALHGGFVCAPLNTAAGPSQLAYVLEHSGTGIVFVSSEHEALLRAALAASARDVRIVPADPDRGPEWPAGRLEGPLPAVDPDDDALLIYTSGTTGRPKGVLLTHTNMLSGGRNAAGAHALQAGDRGLCVLPLCHINALAVSLLGTLVSGGVLILPHGFSLSKFWGWVTGHGCTWFSVVPTIIGYLLRDAHAPGAPGRDALGDVRFGRSASAPLAPALHEQFESRFGIPIIETMGITEAAAQILANPLPPAVRKIGSPGVPYGNEVRIGTEASGLAPREQGEILVRGPNVMRGYHRDPQATRTTIDPDGWLHTGDLGYRDEDGFVFVSGRLKELIIKGGENISPREIDDALYAHPAVVEAGAVGVPDERYGEEVVACVVVRDGAACEARELIEHCVERTGEFKAPRTIYFMKTLPKGPSGKILRHELAAIVRREKARA